MIKIPSLRNFFYLSKYLYNYKNFRKKNSFTEKIN